MDGWDRTRRPARLGQHLRGNGAKRGCRCRQPPATPGGQSSPVRTDRAAIVAWARSRASVRRSAPQSGTTGRTTAATAPWRRSGAVGPGPLCPPRTPASTRSPRCRVPLRTSAWPLGDPTTKTLSERWNGSTWSIVPTPSGEPGLVSVSCVSQSFCMAVGVGSNNDPGHLAEEWNGMVWTVLPESGGAGGLDGVRVVLCRRLLQGSWECDHSSGRRLLAGCCSRDLERSSVDPRCHPEPFGQDLPLGGVVLQSRLVHGGGL